MGQPQIDARAIIDLCTKFVAEPSMPGNERGVTDAIRAAMEQFDFDEIHIDDYGSITATRKAPSGTGTVLLDGHTDTVSPGNIDLWDNDPYTVTEVNGRLIGRGVTDMKGAIAAMIVGVASVPRESLSADIVVSASVCEEAVEGVALGKVLDRIPADIVVIGESTVCELAIGQRGRGELLVETFGKAAHSSTPHLGINTVKHMARIITRLSAIEPPEQEELGKGVLEVTDVMSHPYPGLSVIPEHCAATFDRRLLVGETEEGLLASIQHVLDDLKSEIPELNAKVSIPKTDVTTYPGTPMIAPKFAPAWLFETDHPVVTAGLESLELAGIKPVTRTYAFCTNGSESAGRRDIPTLGFGPGSEEAAHTVNESIEIEQLVTAAKGYASMAQVLGRAIG
jgi:putative selenium metabolism hydrolase